MALSTYALFDIAEFRDHLGGITGTKNDPRIEALANQATEVVEAYLDRQIVTRGDQTEYHSMLPTGEGVSELHTLEWPIVTVTDVWEAITWPRTYSASEKLVVNTDYLISKPRGILHRIFSGGCLWWAQGLRSIKVTYKAGYLTTADVPAIIKETALRYAALAYRENERQQQGVSSMSDAAGNVTRFGPARLTKDMQDTLTNERRSRFHETGERMV